MYNIKFKELIKKNLIPTSQWILTDVNPILRQVNIDVEGNEFSKEDIYYLKKMVNYIEACYYDKDRKYKIRKGVAVAAPQVGWNKRVIYIHFDDENQEHHYLLINPKIVASSQEMAYLATGEGCLSVNPDQPGYVVRNYKVTIQAYDLVSETMITKEFSDFASICVQHEIDHLDGKLYYDYIKNDDKFYADPKWIKIGG